MNKAAKKAANLAAKATGRTENHEAKTPAKVMTVLKPETEKKEPAPDPKPKTQDKAPVPQPESQPKPKQILSISEIKMKAKEAQYLAEQHDNLLIQLEKLQQFAAEVGEEATLRLTSDGLKSFSSKDPQAVAQMVEICTSNIQRRIEIVEQKLTA